MPTPPLSVGHGQARVLQALATFETPATVADLRRATGLGPSTLREHLSALAEAGQVTRMSLRSGRRGRPSIAYLVREPEHEGLARVLVEALAQDPVDEPDGKSAVVEQAGRTWGHRIVAQLGRLMRSDATERERVELALDHAGFGHERDGDDVRIIACPLLELARSHPDIVCRAHLGMLQGVLDSTESPDLVRFDPGGGCLVRLP